MAASLAEDLQEIEALSAACQRPRVKAYLDAYAGQLRKLLDAGNPPPTSLDAPPTAAAAPVPPPAATPAPAPTPTPISCGLQSPPPPVPLPPQQDRAQAEPSLAYTGITAFAWDQDDYGKEPAHVYVYLTSGLDGIGEAKECVHWDFGKRSFDLRIVGFGGKNYRLRKDNLDKEIDPALSKVVIKKDRVTLKMRKVKGTYGYDHWLDLVTKRGAAPAAETKAAEADPGAGLMDLMKQVNNTMGKRKGDRKPRLRHSTAAWRGP
jgi:calcyclin binding protein